MDLNTLESLLSRTRQKAKEHSAVFAKSEAATRYSLIDPVLDALGWDLADPLHSIAEFGVGKNRADYAMFGKSTAIPALFIEAKRLGTNLRQNLDQAITYCNGEGVKYFVITDGINWQAYDVFKPVPNSDKKIFEIDLNVTGDSESVIQLIWLWRQNFTSDSEPIKAKLHARKATTPEQGQVVDPGRGISLSAVFEMTKAHKFLKPPELVLTPDGATHSIITWTEMQITVAEWLVENKFLTPAMCPVRSKGGGHILHTKPVAKNGKTFWSPHEIGGMWIVKSRDAKDHARISLELATAAGSQDINIVGPNTWPLPNGK